MPGVRNTDYERFKALTYDGVPTIRALLCREFAGLSWNGLSEYLSTDARASRLVFDPTKFGKYNTAPTRQTLTTALDGKLSDSAKRAILAVSERLIAVVYEDGETLDLRLPRHVTENDSDLRERHGREFSDDYIRQPVRLVRETIFGGFDAGRAARDATTTSPGANT